MALENEGLEGALGRILSDPEALSKALQTVTALKDSGALDGVFSGLGVSGGQNGTFRERQREEAAPPARTGPERQSKPVPDSVEDAGRGFNAGALTAALFSGAYDHTRTSYTETNDAQSAPTSGAPNGENARRRALLSALRPYMGRERREMIDTVMKILKLLETVSTLSALGVFTQAADRKE